MISKEKVEWFTFPKKKKGKKRRNESLYLKLLEICTIFPFYVCVGQFIFIFLCAMNYHYLIPSAPNFIMFNQFPLVNTTKKWCIGNMKDTHSNLNLAPPIVLPPSCYTVQALFAYFRITIYCWHLIHVNNGSHYVLQIISYSRKLNFFKRSLCNFFEVPYLIPHVYWRTPKLFDGLNYESKGEYNKRRMSWGAFFGS